MNTSKNETKAEMAEEIARLRKRVQKFEKAESKLRQTETKFGNNLGLLNSIFEETTDAIFIKDLKGRHLLVNSVCAQIIGKSVTEIIGKNNEQLFPPEVARHLTEIDERIVASGAPQTLEEVVQPAGSDSPRTYLTTKAPLRDDNNNITGLFGIARDISERKQANRMLATQTEVLRMIAMGAALPEVLEQLCLLIEQHSAGALCSILLFDETSGKLHSGAAPSLPQEYARALDGLMVGEGQGSCGTAVALGKQVIVHDIAADPLWTGFRALALKHGIRSCWSTPFSSRGGKVLGTFAISHKVPCSPAPYHQQLIQTATHLAGIATERKRAEEESRASKERYRALYEDNPSMYFIVDAKGTVVSVNSYGAQQLGYSVEELVGQPVLDVFYPDDKAAVTEQLKSCLNKPGQVVHWEFRKVRKDGSMLWVREAARAVKDIDGNQVVFVVCADITDRKQAEEKLRDSEIRSRTLLEGSPVCNKIIDLDSRLLYMSAAGVKRLKIPDIKSFYGCTYPPDFFPDSTRASLTKHLEQAKAGEISSVECPALDMEGCEVWYHTTFVPARDDEGRIKYIIASSVDITERKQAEEKRKQLEEQLDQVQKMETLGTLAGGIAHDFNNILQAIHGYVDMSLDEVPPKSQAHADLQEVMKATNRGKEIVQQILAFSRREVCEPTPLRLYPIVREVLNLLKATLPATLDLRQNLNRKCGTVLADPGQIHQVVMNLCTNAFQAMRKNGGVLTVSLEKAVSDDEFLQSHPKLNEQEYVQLTVSDTGEGMDQITMARIFEPFFTTKDVGEGTGLGLSVVHGIVTSHKGEITVESEPEKGATFRVYLPVIESAAKQVTAKVRQIPAGHERILLVDDQEIIVSVMKRLLQRSGYEVTTSSGGVESLETFRAHPDSFDLVITDQIMPKMTGMKLAGELRSIRSDLPIILMSGFAEDVSEDLAKAMGIKEFILKPVSSDDLSKAVRRAMDGKPAR